MLLRTLAALLLALSSVGCETPPDLEHPRLFWSDALTFRYPGNWSVTEQLHDEGGITYRILFVESPGSAIVLVTCFEPPLDLSLEEYAADFHRSLLEEAGEMGRVGSWRPLSGEAGTSGPALARIGGLPNEGVEYVYSLTLLGTEVPHILRVFRVETDASTTFLAVQAPAADWSGVARAFELVVESFEAP